MSCKLLSCSYSQTKLSDASMLASYFYQYNECNVVFAFYKRTCAASKSQSGGQQPTDCLTEMIEQPFHFHFKFCDGGISTASQKLKKVNELSSYNFYSIQ